MIRPAVLPALLPCLIAAACAGGPPGARLPAAAAEAPAVAVIEGSGAARPAPRPEAGATLALRPPAPPEGARSPEALDPTAAAERAAARDAPGTEGAGRALGATIASLGAPADPGFWLRTPLVAAPARGRVVLPATGAAVLVELRPSGGAPGSGSQLSLAAFRRLGLPLTALPELEVFAF